MTKAIFTIKAGSGYDDRPEEYYHFPRAYLNQVEKAVGDYIIYYEPRRSLPGIAGGRQAYIATARVTQVVPDSNQPDHFYARVADYLDFDSPVPFLERDQYYESSLRKTDGTTNKGAFGRAVRLIPDLEFDAILRAGFAAEILTAQEKNVPTAFGFREADETYIRPIVEMTVLRPFRDQAFKRAVRLAYQNRCAVTGLCLINGGGRPEVQAAHIKPVSYLGPDSIRNGLALSGTFHWMFDRGLISISDDYKILAARGKIPEQALRMLNQSGEINLPLDKSLHPNPHYLKFHREQVFKG